MEITRDVILDLLPLYVADEASADTRALVEEYLKTDPELAEMAKDPGAVRLPNDIPVQLSTEDRMQAYREAKRYMFWRTVVVAAIVSFSFLCLAALALLGLGFFIP
jgi:anti-sigma factor RsiW